ncbi:MAG: hypothetical protein AAGA53_17505 [Pseudomonadota bacterium]
MHKPKLSAATIAICATLLSSLGWSVLFLLIYRVPIPFSGYTGPFGDVVLDKIIGPW